VELDVARRVACSLGGRRCSLNPAEGEDAEYRAGHDTGQPVEAGWRVLRREHRQRVMAAGVDYQQHAHDEKHGDLEHAKDRAEPGRGPDAEVTGREDDEQAEYRP